MECFACGRKLTNDPSKPNAAYWTLALDRVPYCADSKDCQRDAFAYEAEQLGRKS